MADTPKLWVPEDQDSKVLKLQLFQTILKENKTLGANEALAFAKQAFAWVVQKDTTS